MTLTNDQKAALYYELIADIKDLKAYAEIEHKKAMDEYYNKPHSMTAKPVWKTRIDRMLTEYHLCRHLIEENQNRIDAAEYSEVKHG